MIDLLKSFIYKDRSVVFQAAAERKSTTEVFLILYVTIIYGCYIVN
jgi:hypothetical protein